MLGRHGGDADVDFAIGHPQTRRAVLRQAPFRDVEASENLSCAKSTPAAGPAAALARPAASRRRGCAQ